MVVDRYDCVADVPGLGLREEQVLDGLRHRTIRYRQGPSRHPALPPPPGTCRDRPRILRRVRGPTSAVRPLSAAVVVLLVVSVLAADDMRAGRGAAPKASKAVEVLDVASPEPGTPPRQVWVWRPRVPERRSLPVLYFLHGVPGTAAAPFRDGGL